MMPTLRNFFVKYTHRNALIINNNLTNSYKINYHPYTHVQCQDIIYVPRNSLLTLCAYFWQFFIVRRKFFVRIIRGLGHCCLPPKRLLIASAMCLVGWDYRSPGSKVMTCRTGGWLECRCSVQGLRCRSGREGILLDSYCCTCSRLWLLSPSSLEASKMRSSKFLNWKMCPRPVLPCLTASGNFLEVCQFLPQRDTTALRLPWSWAVQQPCIRVDVIPCSLTSHSLLFPSVRSGYSSLSFSASEL